MVEIKLKQNVEKLLKKYLELKREYESFERVNSEKRSAEGDYLSAIQTKQIQLANLKEKLEKRDRLLKLQEGKLKRIKSRVDSINKLMGNL